jgi:pseudouridine-5'-phosphate glycosidase
MIASFAVAIVLVIATIAIVMGQIGAGLDDDELDAREERQEQLEERREELQEQLEEQREN